jgi:hypothetical protein
MAAHLARHMNTIHGKGGGTAKSAAGRKVKRRGRPPGKRRAAVFAGPVALGGGGPEHLIDEIRSYHNGLIAHRAGIDAQIENLEAAMRALGSANGRIRPPRARRRGRPPGRPPGRPAGAVRRGRPPADASGRSGSLKDMIQQVLRQSARPMSPRDIADSVVTAGYNTRAKDLTKAVSNTLPELKGIKRVGFGQYTV